MEAFQDLWSPPFQGGYYQLCPQKNKWNQMNHPGPQTQIITQAYSSHVSFIPPKKNLSLYVLVVFSHDLGIQNPKGYGHDPSRCHAYWRLIIFIHLRCFTRSTNEGTPGVNSALQRTPRTVVYKELPPTKWGDKKKSWFFVSSIEIGSILFGKNWWSFNSYP